MKRVGSLLIGLLWIQMYGWAQLDPEPAFDWIDANNINGRINSNGALFYDFENGQFSANGGPSTIRAMGLWIAGLNPAANLKGAIQIQNEDGKTDFWPGPLSVDGTISDPDFNGVWKVSRTDITAHLEAWNAAQQAGETLDPATIPVSILAWPGRGNPFFADQNDFDIPESPQGLATFWDQNADGIYDPVAGDYPYLPVSGADFPVLPDQMLWTVFNDVADVHSQSQMMPAKLEVQLTAFAYDCAEEDILNNTVFLHYKIIHRDIEPLDSLFYGVFTDLDIGCPDDDYFGSIPGLRTFYAYNADNEDDTCEDFVSFGENPPVQAVTFLRGPIAPDLNDAGNGVYVPVNQDDPALSLPTQPVEFYDFLSGTGLDGLPMENDGVFYVDNPNLNTGWSEYTADNAPGDRKGLAAFNPLAMPPGAVNEFVVALTYYDKPGASHLENVQEVYANSWKLFSVMEEGFEFPCDIVACDNCVWPGDTNSDGLVSNLDILPIGLGYGEAGPERENASLDWLAQQAPDWEQSLAGGTNYKFIDADGNGLLEFADAQVVDANFGLYYEEEDVPPVVNPGLDFYLIPSVDTLEEGEEVTVEIVLGTEGQPIEDLYGLAFSITYDSDYLAFSGSSFEGGWIGEGDELLLLARDVPQIGQVQFGLSRIDHTNITGQGIIGSFSLTVKDDIMGRNSSLETLLQFVNIYGVSEDETELDLGGKDLQLVLTSPDIVNSAIEHAQNPIRLYPNPAKASLNVELPEVEDADIQIFDTMGKMVIRQPIDAKTMTIPTDQLRPGLYLLKVQLKETSWRRKFLVLW